MQIEARGREGILREVLGILREKLQNSDYLAGPVLQRIDDGNLIYTKDGRIVCVQLAEAEGEECILTVESETEIPELYEIWDDSLIEWFRKTKQEVLNFAMNKQKVEQGIR